MNRGLDAAERYRANKRDELLKQEIFRLMGKAAEMRHPTDSVDTPERSAFYQAAIAAMQRHVKSR